jgi:DNA repair protein RecO (recombination protein O)
MTNLAIIISRKDYRENHVLLDLYTQNSGRIKLLARGAKKFKAKLSSHLEPLSLVEILIIPSKSIDYLASSNTKNYFTGIKNSWSKLETAGKVLNVFSQTVKDNEKEEKLFNYLLLWLNKLDDLEEENCSYLFSLWMIHFLELLGYMPNLKNCQSCQKKLNSGRQYFNFSLGGLLCLDCKNKFSLTNLYQLSENSIKLLRFLANNQEKIIVKKTLIKELDIFLDKYWQYYKN